MKEVLTIYKKAGETPLEALENFKQKNPEYKSISMTYAGRLDPLAEGVLLVLAGDMVHQKDKYLKLDKEYEAEIILGIKTDSFDILGLPNYRHPMSIVEERDVKRFEGDFEFELPAFSSYKIKGPSADEAGKPLFWWAKKGVLGEIKIPKRTTKIYKIDFLGKHQIGSEKLLELILRKISLVKGDFRQEEIKNAWQDLLKSSVGSLASNRFDVVKIKVNCSSGTYIRSLANKLGGVLLGLKRTKVGSYDIM